MTKTTAEALIEGWARLNVKHPDYHDLVHLIPARCRQFVNERNAEHTQKSKRLTLRISIDQTPSEPGDSSMHHVAESYKDLKTPKGWSVQCVPDVAASQRSRDLWVSVDTMATHGEADLPSSTLKELCQGIAQEWAYWADGDVYGYSIEDENGDEVDSCWGFLGELYLNTDHHMWEDIKNAIETETDGGKVVKVTGDAGFDSLADIPGDIPQEASE